MSIFRKQCPMCRGYGSTGPRLSHPRESHYYMGVAEGHRAAVHHNIRFPACLSCGGRGSTARMWSWIAAMALITAAGVVAVERINPFMTRTSHVYSSDRKLVALGRIADVPYQHLLVRFPEGERVVPSHFELGAHEVPDVTPGWQFQWNAYTDPFWTAHSVSVPRGGYPEELSTPGAAGAARP